MAKKIRVMPETLAGIHFLNALPTVAREDLLRRAKGGYSYATNEMIISYEEQSTDVFFIISGRVQVILFSETGKLTNFREEQAGQMFGEIAAIDGAPRSADVVALEETSILSLSADVFMGLMRDHGEVMEGTLKRLSSLVRDLSDRVHKFGAWPVRDRVCMELWRLGREHLREDGTAILSPAPKQTDLAARVATHREAVSRALSELRKQGIVEKQGRALLIRDIERLRPKRP